MFDPSKKDVVILCGGFGKRLQNIIKEIPKPMAEINHRPFLEILIDFVASFGFKRFILCTGYKSKIIETYFQHKGGNLKIEFSKEERPLGTGGAIKNAERYIKSNPFLVMNGDCFSKINLEKFIKFHLNKNALISIAITILKDDKNDYGVITLDDSSRITKFSEKTKKYKTSFINTGTYLFNKEVLSLMPADKTLSLEKDFFPASVHKKIYGYITQKAFIDIGTPERYGKAKMFFKKI